MINIRCESCCYYLVLLVIGISGSAMAGDSVSRCNHELKRKNYMEAYVWCYVADAVGHTSARYQLRQAEEYLNIGEVSKAIKKANNILENYTKERVHEKKLTVEIRAPESLDPRCNIDYDCVRWLDADVNNFSDPRYSAKVNEGLRESFAGEICDQRYPNNFVLRTECKKKQLAMSRMVTRKLKRLIDYGSESELIRFGECNKRDDKTNLMDAELVNKCLD